MLIRNVHHCRSGCTSNRALLALVCIHKPIQLCIELALYESSGAILFALRVSITVTVISQAKLSTILATVCSCRLSTCLRCTRSHSVAIAIFCFLLLCGLTCSMPIRFRRLCFPLGLHDCHGQAHAWLDALGGCSRTPLCICTGNPCQQTELSVNCSTAHL